jgi:predicted RNA-binding protein with PIN domain
MGSHVILDGYNLIGTSSRYRSHREESMEVAREALIEDLRRYKREKRFRFTVVFDGTFTQLSGLHRTSYKGVHVVYSRAGEKADDVIVGMVKASPEGAVVVSSDREVINRCHELGAATISSEDFEDRIVFALMIEVQGVVEDDASEPRVSTRKRGPARKPGRRQRRDRKRLDRL